MRIKVLIFAIVVSSGIVYGSDCNLSKCEQIPQHYEELGCKSVKKAGECCAKSFDCKHLDGRDESKCYYKGNVLSVGDTVDATLLMGSCIGSCHCTQNRFIYAQMSCAEHFTKLEAGCVRQYAIDKCCSIGTVCGLAAKKLSTCAFEGKSYKDGEYMHPKDLKCRRCLCTKTFEDKPVDENKDCVKTSCNIELSETDNVKNGCIPSYHEDSCCPNTWRCPSLTDVIIKGNKNMPADPTRPKCKFGKLFMEIGDSLSTGENDCITCACKIPPMAQCVFTGCPK